MNKLTIIILVFSMKICLAQNVSIFFLKDGSIIQGKVVNENQHRIFLKTDQGTIKIIPSDIIGREDSAKKGDLTFMSERLEYLQGNVTHLTGKVSHWNDSLKTVVDDLQVLFERLEKLDPAAALAIDKANSRRVIRALEVIKITGKPFTANLPREESSRYPHAKQFGLVMDRDTLSERISVRVERMWEKGLVQEAEKLLTAGIMRGTTAQRALGYAQVIAQIEGKVSQEEAQEETKRATRQYARRQETWFSRDERIAWISPTQSALERILESTN